MSCIKSLTFRSLQDVRFWGSLNIILIQSTFPSSLPSCFSFLNTFLRKSISLSLLSKSASLVLAGVKCAWCLEQSFSERYLWTSCIGKHPIDPKVLGPNSDLRNEKLWWRDSGICISTSLVFLLHLEWRSCRSMASKADQNLLSAPPPTFPLNLKL